MSAHFTRTLAVAAGVGALTLSLAAPALADDATGGGATKVSMTAGEVKTVAVTVADAATLTVCPSTVTTWTAKKASPKMTAVEVTSNTQCVNGVVSVVLTASSTSPKKNATVKLVGTDAAQAVVAVDTIVVKVTGANKPGSGKPANPGKGNKS